jgi:hypothetical protein
MVRVGNNCEDYSPHPFTVISHLSTGDHAIDEKAFKSTLKYIFKFIEKIRDSNSNSRDRLLHFLLEKQVEAIVEKLCQRFQLTENPGNPGKEVDQKNTILS